MTTNILIAHRYPLSRMALTEIIEQSIENASSIEIDDIGNVEAVLAFSPGISLLILDLDLINVDLERYLVRLLKTHPKMKILLTSDQVSTALIKHLINLGVSGWVSMRDPEQNMVSAIGSILHGEKCFPCNEETMVSPQIDNLDNLSQREVGVLEQLNRGLMNQQISDELSISLNTTKAHVCSILNKLGVSNRTHAVSLYRQSNYRIGNNNSNSIHGAL